MNPPNLKKAIVVNLAFWAVAILFPIAVRMLPSSSGETPRFFEFFIPLFQIMLAAGATWHLKSAIDQSKAD